MGDKRGGIFYFTANGKKIKGTINACMELDCSVYTLNKLIKKGATFEHKGIEVSWYWEKIEPKENGRWAVLKDKLIEKGVFDEFLEDKKERQKKSYNNPKPTRRYNDGSESLEAVKRKNEYYSGLILEYGRKKDLVMTYSPLSFKIKNPKKYRLMVVFNHKKRAGIVKGQKMGTNPFDYRIANSQQK